MILERLIEKLTELDADLIVEYDYIGDAIKMRQYPGCFDSYRGYYDQLMLSPCSTPITVGELIQKGRDAIGSTFEGYKGGEYIMHGDTIVYVDNYGECNQQQIVDVEQCDDIVRLIVAQIS